jgi:hypothetical protein
MRWRWVSAVAAAVLAVFVALSVSQVAPANAAHGFPLDHFTCYTATGPFTPRTVSLRDQFEVKETNVLRVKSICPPTTKNAEQIHDRESHLLCHAIADVPGQPAFQPRNVQVTNQFGQANMTVTAIDSLCLPTLKSLTGYPPATQPPPPISHFKCYRAKQNSPVHSLLLLSLSDQFVNAAPPVSAYSPVILCNPVSKNNEPVPDLISHLVCYPVEWRPFYRNQFGQSRVRTTLGRQLCVPSTKVELPEASQ